MNRIAINESEGLDMRPSHNGQLSTDDSRRIIGTFKILDTTIVMENKTISIIAGVAGTIVAALGAVGVLPVEVAGAIGIILAWASGKHAEAPKK